MRRRITRTALITLSVILAMTVLTSLGACAGKTGRLNTAILLDSATVYFLAHDKPGAALLTAAGAAYAWDRYDDSRRSDRCGDRRYYYRDDNWDRDRSRDRDRRSDRDRDRGRDRDRDKWQKNRRDRGDN